MRNRTPQELEGPDETAAVDDHEAPVGRVRRLRRWLGERGAGLVEYVLLLSLIALVCIAAISMLGGETNEGPRGVDNSASSIINAG